MGFSFFQFSPNIRKFLYNYHLIISVIYEEKSIVLEKKQEKRKIQS